MQVFLGTIRAKPKKEKNMKTITVFANTAASKKWKNADASLSITKAYSFPSYVKTFIESL